MKTVLVALSLALPAMAALASSGITAAVAANGIDVTRGSDSNVYGNCVPSLVVENKSGETIDYLQVDVVLALRDGRQRTIELKSGYREGAPSPIAPGTRTTLRQHLDTSRALGVPCGEVAERRVSRTVCETAHGTACASSVSVHP
ncbi:hypothetical protein KQ910_05830 [Reyranella sp. MMS21-HV4-11]|uniref:Uncharacterized protein n=1 Tax=Reyranella humidisoli TaxID=2849149 RepID=A0ABS6IJ24_9HYPH|nr:hypothetical protein [Reyranella sp. MMS21-HV4-11]MBU8873273.1 hypothetical protein [Reyranella sp. MMS21-HV4-11]